MRIRLLTEGAKVPAQQFATDAALDLHAASDAHLEPFARAAVPTGVAVSIPEGYAGLVLPRSGLASKHGITLANAPGLIDPGYTGEIKVILVNLDSRAAYDVRAGDRIAQLMIVESLGTRWHEVESLDDTDRGPRGFGSTGA